MDAFGLIVRAIAAVAALVAGMASNASSPPSPVRPYYDFVHWMAMGQPERALAQFAQDAVVIAGPQCTIEAPCVGHAAIRERYLASIMLREAVLPLKVIRFDGRTIHTRDGPALRASFDGQAASWHPGHAITLRDDHIVALRIEWN